MSGLSDEVREAVALTICRDLDCINYDSEVPGGCSRCTEDAERFAPLIHQAEARGAAAERAKVDVVLDSMIELPGQASMTIALHTAARRLRAALTTEAGTQ